MELDKGIVLIGLGISHYAVLIKLLEKKYQGKVIVVSSEDLLPNVSMRAPIIVSHAGVERGVSLLGDLLCDGFEEWQKILLEYGGKGCHQVEHFRVKQEVSRERYGKVCRWRCPLTYEDRNGWVHQSWLVEQSTFFQSLNHHLDRGLNIEWCQDSVIELKESSLLLKSGRCLEFDKLCLGANAYNEVLYHSEKLKHKIINGSWLEWDSVIHEKSFVITSNRANLIYQKFSRKLILTGTSQLENIWAIDLYHLKDLYQEFENFHLPSLDKASLRALARQKCSKRLPQLIFLEQDICCVQGMYKNGYLLSWPMANKLIEAWGI